MKKKKMSKALSKRIRSLRESLGISQQELAVQADLSVSQVAKLEQGSKANPRSSTILALAKALQVKPGQILDDLMPSEEDRTNRGNKAATPGRANAALDREVEKERKMEKKKKGRKEKGKKERTPAS